MPDSSVPFQRLQDSQPYPYTRSEYLRRFAWAIVQATLVRWSLPRAWGWRRWLLRCFGARMGEHSSIRPSTRVLHPWLLTMAPRSLIADGVVIYNLGPVTIGTQTIVSQDVYVCAGTHDYTQANLPLVRSPVTIGSGVWICAGAFLCPGAVVGDNAVVGARAVVAGTVPSGVVVAGNPAKVIKARRMQLAEDLNAAIPSSPETAEPPDRNRDASRREAL